MREKTYDELSFTDDYLFGKIMTHHLDVAKRLLELILGKQISEVRLAQAQKSIKLTPLDRGVRFDVYLEDDADTVYDIEMQTTDQKDLNKRSRYYQAMIDLDSVEQGDAFAKLKDSYVIFICTEQPEILPGNRAIYEFENRCVDEPSIALNDGTRILFVNASGALSDADPALQALLTFIKTKEATDSFTDQIQAFVDEAKSSKEWRMDYMTLYEKLKIARDEGREAGMAEGRRAGAAEARTEMAYKSISEGLIPEATAARMLGISVDELMEQFKRAGYALPVKE